MHLQIAAKSSFLANTDKRSLFCQITLVFVNRSISGSSSGGTRHTVMYGTLVRDDTVPPPNWQRSVWQLNGNSTNNNGYENEDLIVWMRTAALPTFRKLYRRVDHVGPFKNGLPKGNYSLAVAYSEFVSCRVTNRECRSDLYSAHFHADVPIPAHFHNSCLLLTPLFSISMPMPTFITL